MRDQAIGHNLLTFCDKPDDTYSFFILAVANFAKVRAVILDFTGK